MSDHHDGDREVDPALADLHMSLRSVDTLPVGERVAVFEQLNDGIARELARLDEV